jgi:glucose-6-phosphate isomerase
MSGLTFSDWGVSAEAIGGDGVAAEDRQAMNQLNASALEALHRARESQALGFFDLPEYDFEPIVAWAEEKRRGVEDVVVVGIGGSSLGARAILATEPPRERRPTIHFTENIDPITFQRLVDKLDFTRTLVVVITKSGTTIETMSKFAFLWTKLRERLGDGAGERVVAITDPEKGGLRALVDQHGFDDFSVPPNVGGRFSVLTPVGFIPLAFAGYPIGELLEGAAAARDAGLDPDLSRNPVARAATDHYVLMQRGYTQTVMMAYSDVLGPLVDWFCQLWGESLGKAVDRHGERVEVGLTPIKALGVVDQHSQLQLYAEGPRDKHIVFVEVDQFPNDVAIPKVDGFPDSLAHLAGKNLSDLLEAELVGTRRALVEAQRPTSRYRFDTISPRAVGAFIMNWELVTAWMGELLDINAFDQPGVELGKKIAHGLLGRAGFEEWAARTEEPSDQADFSIA